MKSVDQEHGSLLDSSLIVSDCSVPNKNNHHEHNLPLILAGLGGEIAPAGRRLITEKDTPLGNRHVSLLERMGDWTRPLWAEHGKIQLES
ncbi:MAG: hypothetical protein P8M80_13100 [Pirellulaceae bacterium]|nr:hypothetical protein [Pirellulaceae bacterium]